MWFCVFDIIRKGLGNSSRDGKKSLKLTPPPCLHVCVFLNHPRPSSTCTSCRFPNGDLGLNALFVDLVCCSFTFVVYQTPLSSIDCEYCCVSVGSRRILHLSPVLDQLNQRRQRDRVHLSGVEQSFPSEIMFDFCLYFVVGLGSGTLA